jgi:hypothetical protein
MRINIYAHLIIIEILDDIYARAQTWSTVEYWVLYGTSLRGTEYFSTKLESIKENYVLVNTTSRSGR